MALPAILAGLNNEKAGVELDAEKIIALLSSANVCTLSIPYVIKTTYVSPKKQEIPEGEYPSKVVGGIMYAQLFETSTVPVEGFLIKKGATRSVIEEKNIPVAEALKKLLPENVAILSLVFDGRNKEIRILYLPLSQ